VGILKAAVLASLWWRRWQRRGGGVGILVAAVLASSWLWQNGGENKTFVMVFLFLRL
jgi:hypothetical protein